MEDKNSTVSLICYSCGRKFNGAQVQDSKQVCETCQAKMAVEAEVLNSNGTRVLIKCRKCEKPISAVASLRGSNSVWCKSCISELQVGIPLVPSKSQSDRKILEVNDVRRSGNPIEKTKIEEPKKKNLEETRVFLWVMGIGWTLAIINTVATANKSGSMSPESLGGGIGGFAIYFLFAGIIWNVIIGILWGLIKAIISPFQRKR